jgi:hypothetical protein
MANDKHDPITGRFTEGGGVHGKSFTPEFNSWSMMMKRCYNPNDKRFNHYGGRGITVCDRWLEAKNFLEDMGERPSPKHSLGRIDNDKGYSPENCRWETPTQQSRNRAYVKLTMAAAREIRMLYGRGYTQRELAREFKVSQRQVFSVLHNEVWKEE